MKTDSAGLVEEELIVAETIERLPGGDTVEIVEIVDIEVFVKEKPAHRKPRARKYRIKIDKTYYTVDVPSMTGRQLLALAGKVPVEKYMISQKFHGGQVLPIALDENVDFCAPGIERFVTLPLDQTEG